MKKNRYVSNRRRFIRNIGAVGAFSIIPQLSLSSCNSTRKDTESGAQESAPEKTRQEKLGIALVGLGNYATNQLAPALQETEQCYLAGIVTGTPSKARDWRAKYGIAEKNIYNYDTFDEVAGNPDITIIYVVLPNGMHPEYAIRAAQAGKHVISEKPMATSVEDCQRMIDACHQYNVRLSVGYRLHFQPHHQRVMELGQQQVFGKVQKISGAHSFTINDPTLWRLDKELAGGGPLMDVGIYVIQGACYTVGKDPVSVTAKFGEITKPELFDEVEQSIEWTMTFPDGTVAECSSSYADRANFLHGEAQKGWWELRPAYSYSGIRGETSEGPMEFPRVNQQALQMDDFADCIRNNRTSRVPGEMGLRDVRIMMAIYEAAESGQKVNL